MIPELNGPEWYRQMVRVNIDRMSLLALIGLLELTLRHPDLPDQPRQKAVEMGRSFASILLNDGLIIPDEIARSWEKSFNMLCGADPDLIIPELTDSNGRPWK